MKRLFLLAISAMLIIACNNKVRYTQQSAEINTYKQLIKDYDARNWKPYTTYYADTAKILHNVTLKNAQTVAQLLDENKKDAVAFSSWEFVPKNSEYEMIVNDKGQTWVNFWGLWKGTLKANNKTYEIPIHTTSRFVNGKIVMEFGYWDNSAIYLDLQKLQKENALE